MTKQEFYEEIVRLTSEIHATKVAEKIFSQAKAGNAKKVEETLDAFKKENFDLYKRIKEFGKKYMQLIGKNLRYVEIFTAEENKKTGEYVFDVNVIDSLSFFVFIFIANIDNIYLFEFGKASKKNLVDNFVKNGYGEMAEFVSDFSWIDWVGEDEEQYDTLGELLVSIFKGEA